MKRLLAQIGLTYLSVLAVVFYFGKISAFIIMALALVLFVAFLIVKKCRATIYMPVMAFVALVACVVNIFYTTCVYDKTVQTYDSSTKQVVAKLEEEPYKIYDFYHYKFKCIKADGEKCNFRFIAYSDELLNIEELSTIKTEVTLDATDNKSYVSKRYFLTGSFGYGVPQFTVVSPPQKGFKYFAIKLRQEIRENLQSNLSEETSKLCSALLIGDKYALSDSTRQQFTKAGVSHLIVVSGMHFSILVSIFIFLSKRRWLSRFKDVILAFAVLFIFVYMAVTGFVPSVVRSGIMLLIYTVGIIIFDDAYSLNSLGVAALCLVCPNPYLAGDVSLILSFATTFSIIMLSPIIYHKFYKRIISNEPVPKNVTKCKRLFITYSRRISVFLLMMLSVNISAYLASVLLCVIFFGAVPTMSVVASMILYFPIEFLLILSLAIAVISFVPFLSFITVILSQLANLLSYITLSVVNFFADLPFSYLHVRYDFVYLFIVIACILLAWMFISKEKFRLKVISLCLCVIFFFGYASAVYFDSKVSTINVYDVENGIGVMYKSTDTTALLSLDCNNKNAYKAIDKLENTVSELDFVSSVANNQNSYKSLNSLTKAFAIDNVLLYDNKRTVTLPDTVDSLIVPKEHQKVLLNDEDVVAYYMVEDKYVTYLNTKTASLLIVPSGVDAALIPDEYKSASIIVFTKPPKNFELLSCDTLIISAKKDSAYYDMKLCSCICNRALLTSDGDIEIIMEV